MTGLAVFGGVIGADATGFAVEDVAALALALEAGVAALAFALVARFSCFLHVGKLSARRQGIIANLVSINQVRALILRAENTSGFCLCLHRNW